MLLFCARVASTGLRREILKTCISARLKVVLAKAEDGSDKISLEIMKGGLNRNSILAKGEKLFGTILKMRPPSVIALMRDDGRFCANEDALASTHQSTQTQEQRKHAFEARARAISLLVILLDNSINVPI